MNERIKELAEQASSKVTQNFNWDYLPQIDKDIFEKFAELIVRECMYVGRLAQINNQMVDSKIKDHFGVDK